MRGTGIALILLALVLPASAGAQAVPSGNSGIDQYQEAVPGVGGSQLAGAHGPGSTGAVGGESRIPASAVRNLDKLGADGKAAAAAAGATAPTQSQSTEGINTACPTGGLGWGLPLVLLLALVAAVGIVLLGRRRAALGGAAGVLLLCVLFATLVQAAPAPAARGLTTGFADTDRLASPDAAERKLWLDRAVDAGAGIVRLDFAWSAIAPQAARPPDPANPASSSYDFSKIDATIRDITSDGLSVMMNVSLAPPWAEGPNRPPDAAPGTWKPNPFDLADFMTALAKRYSGDFDPDGAGPQPKLPAIQSVQVWNEPNHPVFLTPQYVGQTAFSPIQYRSMLDAAYSAIKAANPNIQVVTAGLSPYGDNPGGDRVRPVTFWQDALCVKPVKTRAKKTKKGKKPKKPPRTTYTRSGDCSGPVMFDVLAHHPINTSGVPTQRAVNPKDASSADLDRIVSVLRGAESVGTTLPGKHQVWADEIWWDTNPPNPAGFPPMTAARYLEQNMYLVWKAGASVAINQFIRDSTENRQNVRFGLQGGLYFADGRPKPSLTAFHFPFVTERLNNKTLTAWGKSPAAGKLAIQRLRGSRWLNVKKLTVGKGDVFTTKLPLKGKQQLRARVAGNQSLVWRQANSRKTTAAAASFGSGCSGRGGGWIMPLVFALSLTGALALALMRRRWRFA